MFDSVCKLDNRGSMDVHFSILILKQDKIIRLRMHKQTFVPKFKDDMHSLTGIK